MNAPITEEDKPAVEAMIKRLVRYRKREHEHGNKLSAEYLSEAIKALQTYGGFKQWWEFPDD